MARIGHSLSGSSFLSSDADSSGNQAQFTLDAAWQGASQEMTNWQSLTAMVAGGLVYRAVKTATLAAFSQSAFSNPLFRFLPKALAPALGLGAEVVAFETVNRGITYARTGLSQNENLLSWSGSGGIWEGLRDSVVTFGILKAGACFNARNILFQHLTQDFAMVLGHEATAHLGWTPEQQGSFLEKLLHAEATNLSIGVGMFMANLLTGHRIQKIEHLLEHQMHTLAAASQYAQQSHDLRRAYEDLAAFRAHEDTEGNHDDFIEAFADESREEALPAEYFASAQEVGRSAASAREAVQIPSFPTDNPAQTEAALRTLENLVSRRGFNDEPGSLRDLVENNDEAFPIEIVRESESQLLSPANDGSAPARSLPLISEAVYQRFLASRTEAMNDNATPREEALPARVMGSDIVDAVSEGPVLRLVSGQAGEGLERVESERIATQFTMIHEEKITASSDDGKKPPLMQPARGGGQTITGGDQGRGGSSGGHPSQSPPSGQPVDLKRLRQGPPKIRGRLHLSASLERKMEALPGNVLEDHQHGVDENPMAFGFNHMKWWMDIVRKEVLNLGVNAVVWGGELLFGRFHEKAEDRAKVRETLEAMVKGERLDIEVIKPNAEEWWAAAFERAARLPSPDLMTLTHMLHLIRSESVREELLNHLAETDFDTAWHLRESFEVNTQFEAPAEHEYFARVRELAQEAANKQDYVGVNGIIEPLFLRYYHSNNAQEIMYGIYHLQKVVDSLVFSGLPNQISGREVGASIPSDAVLIEAGSSCTASALRLPLSPGLDLMCKLTVNRDGSVVIQDPIRILGDPKQTMLGELPEPIILRTHEQGEMAREVTIRNHLRGPCEQALLLPVANENKVYVLVSPKAFQGPLSLPNGIARMIGRGFENDVIVDQDPQVSASHFKIARDHDGSIVVCDNRSRNGLYVTNGPGTPVRLQPETPIRLASENFPIYFGAQKIVDLRKNMRNPIEIVPSKTEAGVWNLQNVQGQQRVVIPPDAMEIKVGETYSVGRDTASFLPLNHGALSRLHFEFGIQADGSLRVTDTRSINGTFWRTQASPWQDKISGTKVFPFGSGTVLHFVDYKITDARTDAHAPAYLCPVQGTAIEWELKNFIGSSQSLPSRGPVEPPATAPILKVKEAQFLRITPDKIEKVPNASNGPVLQVAISEQGEVSVCIQGMKFERGQIDVLAAQILPPVQSGSTAQPAFLAEQARRVLPGGSVQFPAHRINLQNEVRNYKAGERIAIIEGANKTWIIKNFPADKTRNRAVSSPLPRPYFDELPVRDINTIPQEYHALIPRMEGKVLFPRFRRLLDEVSCLMNLPTAIAVRLFGPPGTAKTTIPEMIAAKMGVPLLRIPFSRRTDPRDLEGLWTMEKVNGVLVPVFNSGPLAVCLEYGFHGVLDEPDTARPGTLAALNNYIAHHKTFYVRNKQGRPEEKPVHPGARFWSTENGVAQVGRVEHGADFLRRFASFYVGPWTRAECVQVIHELHGHVNKWPPEFTTLLATFHEHMAKCAKGYTDSRTGKDFPPLGAAIGQRVEFTPRSILRVGSRLSAMGAVTPEGLSRALRAEYILPLADSEDRKLVWDLVKVHFEPVAAKLGFAANSIGPHAIPTPTLEGIYKKYLRGRPFLSNEFVWTNQALRVVDEILWNRSLKIDVMLLGGAGQGKTEIPEAVAALIGLKFRPITLSSESDEEELIGGPGRDPVTGEVHFIPGAVSLTVEEGGLCHIDEALLADPPKVEGVMNSVLDSDRALYQKSPYRRIPRNSTDPNLESFFIFSSNPPFGDYADRNEQSGAAMSRVAVIYLEDEFAMGPEDRVKIVHHMAEQPFEFGDYNPHVPPPPPLRDMGIPNPEAGSVGGPATLRGESRLYSIFDCERVGPDLSRVRVHEDHVKQFGLPPILICDEKTLEFLEEDQQPLKPATVRGLDKMKAYFERRTTFEMGLPTDRMFGIGFGNEGAHHANMANLRLFFNLRYLLLESTLAGLGVGKHEWSHATVDGLFPDYASSLLHLLANVCAEKRMNNFARSLRPDFGKQMDAFEGDRIIVTPADAARYNKLLPHEQFCYGIYHRAYSGQDAPWLTRPDVKDAVARAYPLIEPAFRELPTTTDRAAIDESLARYKPYLDQVRPIYEELLPPSLDEIIQKLLEGMSPEALEQLRQEMQEAQGQAGAGEGEGEPQPGQQGSPGQGGQGSGQNPEPSPGEEPGQGSEAKPGEGKPGVPPPGQPREIPPGMRERAQQILEKRAEQAAQEFEPDSPQLRNQRSQMRQQHLQGSPPSPEADPKANAPQAPMEAPEVPPIADLSEEEAEAMEGKLVRAAQGHIDQSLYRRMLSNETVQDTREFLRLMPPTQPQNQQGYFTSGSRMDRGEAIRDALSPAPTGKVMTRKLGIEGHEASIIFEVDVSYSIELAGAKDNVVRASASLIHFCEAANIDYGEFAFQSNVKEVKGLGRRLGNAAAKNAMLNRVLQAFDDKGLGGGTSIRKALGVAIAQLKLRRGENKLIILLTDGEEFGDYPQSFEEMREDAKSHGIDIMVLAMGDAQKSIPKHFPPDEYEFVAPDGSDISRKIVALMKKVHAKRLRRKR